MAEFLDRELRLNATTTLLTELAKKSLTRVPPPAQGTSYKTLPDGRVIDRYGNVVYEPRLKDASPRT